MCGFGCCVQRCAGAVTRSGRPAAAVAAGNSSIAAVLRPERREARGEKPFFYSAMPRPNHLVGRRKRHERHRRSLARLQGGDIGLGQFKAREQPIGWQKAKGIPDQAPVSTRMRMPELQQRIEAASRWWHRRQPALPVGPDRRLLNSATVPSFSSRKKLIHLVIQHGSGWPSSARMQRISQSPWVSAT